MWLDWLFRRKKDPVARAQEIKAKFEAKRKPQGLFTPAQEELLKELGLTPGDEAQNQKQREAKREAKRLKRKSAPFDLAVDEAERLKKIHSARRGRK
ncbi:MAG: hypothetical protein ACKO8C_06470 [Candidatus Nanopelagicaceae bacterium]